MRWIVLLALGGCFSESLHVYGTDFDRDDGRRILVWPATGDAGAFRFVSGDAPRKHPVTTIPWPIPAALPPEFDAFLGSVLVVQCRPPTAIQHERTMALVERIRAASPYAGIHLLQDDVDWTRIRSSHAAARRITALRKEAADRRDSEGGWAAGLAKVLWLLLEEGFSPERKSADLAVASASIWIVPDPRAPSACAVMVRPVHCSKQGRFAPLERATAGQLPALIERARAASGIEGGADATTLPWFTTCAVVIPEDLADAEERLASIVPFATAPKRMLIALRAERPFDEICSRMERGEPPIELERPVEPGLSSPSTSDRPAGDGG